eukprot:s3079_g5.t1
MFKLKHITSNYFKPDKGLAFQSPDVAATCSNLNQSTSSIRFHRIQPGSRQVLDSANDPSAGSPTETLLRLLLPLSDKVHETFQRNVQKLSTANSSLKINNCNDLSPSRCILKRLPGHFRQDCKLVERISVARVQPRTSKGITDLLHSWWCPSVNSFNFSLATILPPEPKDFDFS